MQRASCSVQLASTSHVAQPLCLPCSFAGGTVVVQVAAAAGGTAEYDLAIGCTLAPPSVSMLSFDPGVLSPPFDPTVHNYTLTLPNRGGRARMLATDYYSVFCAASA